MPQLAVVSNNAMSLSSITHVPGTCVVGGQSVSREIQCPRNVSTTVTNLHCLQ